MNLAMNSPIKETTKAFISQFETGEALPFGETKRQQAVGFLQNAVLPGQKTEDWKYTSLMPITTKEFQQPENYASRSLDICNIPNLEAHTIVFVNGALHSVNMLPGFDSDLMIQSFGSMNETAQIIAEKYFAHLTPPDLDIFTALNTAYGNKGTMIFVPAKRQVQKPIHIQHLTDTNIPIGIQHRNLVIVWEESSVTILETYHGTKQNSTFRNQVTEVIVAENASLSYFKFQHEGRNASHIEQCNVMQQANSQTAFFTVSLSGEIIRNTLRIRINGEGAHAGLKGGYLLDNIEHVDNYTEVHHIKPHSTSNELYKGIIGGQATAVFSGKIQVYPDAQKTQAYQSNKSVLLTDTANVYTKPQLEIYADDVKCSHGATTGQINEEALYYMMTRGISKTEARKLLIGAFLEEIFNEFGVKEVEEYVHRCIQEKMDSIH